jgi:hypothetical protein
MSGICVISITPVAVLEPGPPLPPSSLSTVSCAELAVARNCIPSRAALIS